MLKLRGNDILMADTLRKADWPPYWWNFSSSGAVLPRDVGQNKAAIALLAGSIPVVSRFSS